MPNEKTSGIEKRGFNAGWDMNLQEFMRFDAILKELTAATIAVNNHRLEYLVSYYSLLFTLYLNIKTVMNLAEREELDNRFRMIRDRINLWNAQKSRKKIPYSLVDDLNDLQFRILDIKQRRNLGIKISNNIDPKELGSKFITEI